MTIKYLLLREKIANELENIEKTVIKAKHGFEIAQEKGPDEQDFYLDSVAFNLHSFYSGIERIFEIIAEEIDKEIPQGERWHKDLLEQMSFGLLEIRPAFISKKTKGELVEFLSFRHLVRAIYTFKINPKRLERLVALLQETFDHFKEDLGQFLLFLEKMGEG